MDKDQHKPRKPGEVRDDGSEDERKYRVGGGGRLEDRHCLLRRIYNHVASNHSHFQTLERPPFTDHFDPRLVNLATPPRNIKPLRERLYWATHDLDGYKPGDHGKAELRTEDKVGKRYWVQVLKIGGNSGKTLKRGEYERHIDALGINLDLYEGKVARAAYEVIGKKTLKPLVRIQSQSDPVLYHPNGLRDVLFEIKFDIGIQRTFDGKEFDVVEVEIEVKNAPSSMSNKQIEALLDESEGALFAGKCGQTHFADVLDSVYEAKPTPSFKHLAGWYLENSRAFKEAFKTLPGDRWQEYKPR